MDEPVFDYMCDFYDFCMTNKHYAELKNKADKLSHETHKLRELSDCIEAYLLQNFDKLIIQLPEDKQLLAKELKERYDKLYDELCKVNKEIYKMRTNQLNIEYVKMQLKKMSGEF
jgi:flagellin-specific chaperone FliS